MKQSLSGYDFANVTGWDQSNGLAPQILTFARKRARLLAEKGMSVDNSPQDTERLRGAYHELKTLITALEAAGVNDAS